MEESNLKVITFNLKRDNIFSRCLWESRRDGICSFIKAEEADIIGVQELLPHMRSDISEALEKYNYKIIGDGRESDRGGEHTDIIFSEDRFQLIKNSTFWLSKYPQKAGSRSYMALYPRICTLARLKRRSDGKEFYVYNTHFDHISPFARHAGADIILNSIKKFYLLEPLPVIVMGDFNTRPTSKTLKKLNEQGIIKLKNVLLNDKVCRVRNEKNNTLTNNYLFLNRQIDYIMTSEHFDIVSSEIKKLSDKKHFLSDHNPIVTLLSL